MENEANHHLRKHTVIAFFSHGQKPKLTNPRNVIHAPKGVLLCIATGKQKAWPAVADQTL
jgi:hypothetical protein